MSVKRSVLAVFAILVIAVALVVAILVNRGEPTSSGEEGGIAVPVSFRLKWSFGATSCAALVAKSQGFFEDQGLDVAVRQGGFEYDSKKLVASGADDIGLTGADELILARSNGMPLVAVGADFQNTPCCILARTDSGVTSPEDFAGERLGVRKETNVEYQYDVMMKRLGLNREAVKEEPIKFDLTRVVDGHLDMWTTYVSEKPLGEARGLELNTIWFADHGISSYGNVVFTSEGYLSQNPDIVKRFLAAYYRGWQWAIDNPERIGEVIRQFSPQASPEVETAVLELTLPLLKTEEGKPLGYMTAKRWQETQQILVESGQLETELDVPELFTNEHLTGD